jgi:hypothetical protein
MVDVKRESKWWYDQAKKEKVLPIESVYAANKIPPLRFTDKNHMEWFAEILSIGDYVAGCQVFEVELSPDTIICRYRNQKIEGNFKIYLESTFLAPLQKKLLFDIFETLSLL